MSLYDDEESMKSIGNERKDRKAKEKIYLLSCGWCDTVLKADYEGEASKYCPVCNGERKMESIGFLIRKRWRKGEKQ